MGRGFVALVGVVNIALVTRVDGTEVYGTYAVATAFSTVLGTIVDNGTATVALRHSQTIELPRAVRATVQLRFVAGLFGLVLGGALSVVIFAAGARTASFLALLTIPLAGPSYLTVAGQLAGSLSGFKQTALVLGASNLLATVAAVVLLGHPSAVALVGTNVVASALSTAMAAVLARRLSDSVTRPIEVALWREMGASLGPMGIGSALGSLYSRIDSVILLRLGGASAAGIYAAAYRFVDQVALIPYAASAGITPRIAEQVHVSGSMTPTADSSIREFETLVGPAVGLLVMAGAPWAATVLLGASFVEAGRVATILAVYQSWSIVAYLSTAKVVQAGRYSRFVAITAGGLIANVAANVVLIPHFGVYGSVAATLGTELLTVTGYTLAAREMSAARHGRTLVLNATVGGLFCLLSVYSLDLPFLPHVCVSTFTLCVALTCFVHALKVLDRLGEPEVSGGNSAADLADPGSPSSA